MKEQRTLIFVLILIFGLTGFVSSQNTTDLADKIEQVAILKGHSDYVNSVSFSPDGKLLASGSSDKTVRLWSLSTKSQIAVLEGHSYDVSEVSFSPNSELLASAGTWNGEIKLWDVHEQKESATLKEHLYDVLSVSFSPDGRLLASSSDDKTVKLWDVSTKSVIATLEGHLDYVNSLSFSLDGELLASGSDDAIIKIWDVDKKKEIATLKDHSDSVTTVRFSPDGRLLASASYDETIKLWDVSTKAVIATLEGHSDYVNTLAFSPNGKFLASGSDDNTIKLWDIQEKKELVTLEGHSDDVLSVSFSSDGSFLASGSYDKTIRLWNVSQSSKPTTLKSEEHVQAVIFSPDGELLASTGGKSIKLWDLKTRLKSGKKELATLEGHSSYVDPIAFSPDGELLASGSFDKTIRLWDVSERKELATLDGHSNWVSSVNFSSDGQLLASASPDETIKLWDVSEKKEIATLEGHSQPVTCVAFSPDGKLLASASNDKTVKLWDVSTRTKITTFEGHSDAVNSIAFSPDGKLLASASLDKTIKLWNVPERLDEQKFPPMLTTTLEFAEPSGNNVLDGYEAGTLTAKIQNKGRGTARQIEVILSTQPPIDELQFVELRSIDKIKPQSTETVSFRILASESISNSKVILTVSALENGMGMDAEPANIVITTRKLAAPSLKLAKWGIDDDKRGLSLGNDNGKLEKGETIEFIAIIQNLGAGDAEEVKATVRLNTANIFYVSENTIFELGRIRSGKWKRISFAFSVNRRFNLNRVPISITIEEEKTQFTTTEQIDVPLEELLASQEMIVVKPEDEDTDRVLIDTVPDLGIGVGNIPKTKMSNPSAVAVVVGNKEYEYLDYVKFADRDASAMKEYLVRTLGYKEKKIIYVENATGAKFEELFGTKDNYKGTIYRWVKEGKSDIFIYYSGYGMPSVADGRSSVSLDDVGKTPTRLPASDFSRVSAGSLVPVDFSSRNLNGYPMSTFYTNLKKIKARSYTVVLDAGFSGKTSDGDLLEVIGVDTIGLQIPQFSSTVLPFGENGTIFVSATGAQVNAWYAEKRHSLFTYFFLKGLSGMADMDKDGSVTVYELDTLIRDQDKGVPYYSRRLGYEQTPVTMGDKTRVMVRFGKE